MLSTTLPASDIQIMRPMGVWGTRCVPRCSSCKSDQDLYNPEDDNRRTLCMECRSPLVSLAFSKYYCDLGGQG